MKKILAILSVLLAGIMVSPAPTYYYNRYSTNIDGTYIPILATTITNITFLANGGVVSNYGNVFGVNQTNTGTVQAQTGVYTGAGASIFSGFTNNGIGTFTNTIKYIAPGIAPSTVLGMNSLNNVTNIGALAGMVITTDAATLTTNFNVFQQANAQAQGAIATNGTWFKTRYFGGVQNVQLQNGNRFAPLIGLGATNLIQLVSTPLPSGGYLSNLSVYCSTNNFSTTNYTFTVLTNAIPTTPVTTTLTGVLLGATGNPATNFAGISVVLPFNTNRWGCMQILNSVANTTQPQSFYWSFEHWQQVGQP